MANLNQQQIAEVNEIIELIQKSVKPKAEIGSQSRTILRSQLAIHKIKKKTKFFDIKREYADTIVNYFVNEKKLTKSRFSVNSGESIFLLLYKFKYACS